MIAGVYPVTILVTGYTAVVTIVVTKIVTNSNKKIVTKIIIQKLW